MTDPNTPPAASERMTAERLAHIATVREKIEHGKIPTSMADYHLLLDGLEAIKKFDHLATLHDRIRTLTARAEAAERELAGEREKFTMHTAEVGAWLSALSDVFGVKGENVRDACSKIFDAAEAAEARAERTRAEALEEAAKICERLDLRPDPNGRIDSDGYMIEQIDSENSRPDLAKAIRALLTAPPPTAKEG